MAQSTRGESTRGLHGRSAAPPTEARDEARLRALLASLPRHRVGPRRGRDPHLLQSVGPRRPRLRARRSRRNAGTGPDPSRRPATHAMTFWPAQHATAARLPPIELRMRDRAGTWHWFEADREQPARRPRRQRHRHERTRRHRPQSRERGAARTNAAAIRSPVSRTVSRSWNASRSRCRARPDHAISSPCCSVDLDDFKLVNDNYGHDFADRVLIEIARRLERLQRQSDTVARVGGDEFVVVCDGLHDVDRHSTVSRRGSATRSNDRSPSTAHECLVTASIGIATIDGKNRRARRPADVAAQRRRRDVPRQARRARALAPLRRRCSSRRPAAGSSWKPSSSPHSNGASSSLHYQPIHELARHTIVGVEAFLRWEHPTRGFLRPDDFLEIAEHTGTIVPDRRVGDARRVRAGAPLARRGLARMDVGEPLRARARRTRTRRSGRVRSSTTPVSKPSSSGSS